MKAASMAGKRPLLASPNLRKTGAGEVRNSDFWMLRIRYRLWIVNLNNILLSRRCAGGSWDSAVMKGASFR
jgi:hypothetical protein